MRVWYAGVDCVGRFIVLCSRPCLGQISRPGIRIFLLLHVSGSSTRLIFDVLRLVRGFFGAETATGFFAALADRGFIRNAMLDVYLSRRLVPLFIRTDRDLASGAKTWFVRDNLAVSSYRSATNLVGAVKLLIRDVFVRHHLLNIVCLPALSRAHAILVLQNRNLSD